MLKVLSGIRRAVNAVRFLFHFFRAGMSGCSWREKADFLAKCQQSRGLILRMALSPQKHSQVRSWQLSDDPELADRVCSFLARAAWILPKLYGAKLTVSLFLDETVMLNAHFSQEEIQGLQTRVRELIEQAQRERAGSEHEVVMFVTSLAALLLNLPEREVRWGREDWERGRWERMRGLRYLAGVFLWGWWECGWRKEGWKGRVRLGGQIHPRPGMAYEAGWAGGHKGSRLCEAVGEGDRREAV